MEIIINKNNMLYRHASTVEQLNQKYLGNQTIKIFDICRVYKDGTLKTVSSLPDALTTHYTKHLKTPDDLNGAKANFDMLPEQNNQQNFHFLLPEDAKPKTNALFAQYNINNVFTISLQHENHIDMIGLVKPGEPQDALNNYLNQIEYIVQATKLICLDLAAAFNCNKEDKIDFTPSLKQLVIDHFSSRDESPSIHSPTSPAWQQLCEQYRITLREQQCLQLLLKGYTAKQIAAQLSISHRTVESHMAKLRDKTGLATRYHLVDHFNHLLN